MLLQAPPAGLSPQMQSLQCCCLLAQKLLCALSASGGHQQGSALSQGHFQHILACSSSQCALLHCAHACQAGYIPFVASVMVMMLATVMCLLLGSLTCSKAFTLECCKQQEGVFAFTAYLMYVFASMTSVTSLTGWQSSNAAARGKMFLPNVLEGIRICENLCLNHARGCWNWGS